LIYHQIIDFNDDGSLDVLDVLVLVNHIMGVEILQEELFDVADINEDGLIDVIDIIQLVNMILDN